MKTVSKKLLSILLVAILLVSVIPCLAFATEGDSSTTVAHDENIASHVSSVWTYDDNNHWKLCPNSNCELYGQPIGTTPHTFSNGVCTVCGYQHQNHTESTVNVKEATCVDKGYTGDTVCTVCGRTLALGADTLPTGVHTYVNGICSVCGSVEDGTAFTLTLDANGGTINGGTTMTVNVKQNNAISVLPDPTREGYTFAGWYVGDAQIYLGQSYKFGANVTATAKWTEKTYNLTVRYTLNGSNPQTIVSVNVPAGTPLLNYLNNNVSNDVQSELANHPGYVWEYNFWKDYSGTQSLTSQDQMMNQAQTVYVNFVSKSYTLYFNANGGTVTPTSKTVYYGSAVGTLPTPSLTGKVFQGWQDVNGTIYTASTVYQIAGDSSLTAVWADEASVMLYVYINGDFSGPDRLISLDGYVKNNNVSRSDVYAQIAKYYTPASGTLSIAGLFDDYTWSSYRANTSKAGTDTIQVSDGTKVYVMVNNARTGTTLVTGTTTTTDGTTYTITTTNGTYTITGTVSATTPIGSYWVSNGDGTGYWVYPASSSSTSSTTGTVYVIYTGSNPKTGDTAQIEVAAVIMVLAAAALVTMIIVRKKKA